MKIRVSGTFVRVIEADDEDDYQDKLSFFESKLSAVVDDYEIEDEEDITEPTKKKKGA